MNENTKALNRKNNIFPQRLAVPFALLTVSITWILWWTVVIANKYEFLMYGTPMMMLFYMIGGLSPAISAIVLVLKSKQITGKELIGTICNYKQPVWLYTAVILTALLSYIILLVMNKASVISPFYMSILLIPFNLVGGGLEEIGWRFLFQPALEKKFNFILSAIITAVVWALWHLPLFFIAGTNQFDWNFNYFAIFVLGMSFTLAAIYKASGSIFLCILFHTVWNAIGESITIEMDIVSSTVICIMFIAISFILIKIPGYLRQPKS